MKIRILLFYSVLISIFTCVTSTVVSAETLIIPGTGASEVILQELAAAFNAENPGSEVVIPASVHSGGGIYLVGTDQFVLGRVARPLLNSELNYKLQYLEFAKDMVVFAVGPKVGIDNLSSQQLADIYSGKVKNWKEVGGNDTPVKLLVRDPGDSSHEVIRQHIDLFNHLEFPANAKIVFHDYEMKDALNKYSTVIGWLSGSTMKLVDPAVKTISIDNVAPTQQNVYDGNYGLALHYALIYKEGRLNGLARKFVEFIFSKKGRIIQVQAGLVPVNQQQFK